MFGVDVPDHMDGKPLAVEEGGRGQRREERARQGDGGIMKRRTFRWGLRAAQCGGGGGGWVLAGHRRRVARSAGTMVIVIGIDGMDPVLSRA